LKPTTNAYQTSQPRLKLREFLPNFRFAGNEYLYHLLGGSGVIILAIILVVEDDILLSLDTSEALEDGGFDVIAAANADEAIKVLETRNDIRTIFTDINMPGSMDGLKLAAAVRDRWPPVNIIVTTGMRAPHRDQLPANTIFIAKPYRRAEVLGAVRSFA
jgi:two-component system, response regulator PdtaR